MPYPVTAVAIARPSTTRNPDGTFKVNPRVFVQSPLIGTLPMTRSISLDEDFFERRNLRITCTLKYMDGDFRPQSSEILPNLYLSDMYTATDPFTIKRLGITHVMSVVERMWHAYPSNVQHLWLPVHDNTLVDISSILNPAAEWIRRAMATGDEARVLVHCMSGMSRSASIVIAFLMRELGMDLGTALAHVKVRRPVVQPNAGFVRQLMSYENSLRHRQELKKAT